MTGQELKDFRLSLGLSQAVFGESLGIKNSQVQVSQLENGDRPITKRLAMSVERWIENIKLKKEIKNYGAQRQ